MRPSRRAIVLLLLVVGIVLSPLRAVAATIPALFAYDAAVRPTSTMAPGRPDAVGREAERAPTNDYEATAFGYDGPSNLRVAAGVEPVRAYDGRVEHAHGREDHGEGAIYDAPSATTAAEGSIAQFLRETGNTVTKNPSEGVAGAGRQGDAFVNGVKTEFKTLASGATSNTIRNVVNNSIRGGGQARSIFIDARGSGLTFDAASQGVSRALGISRGMVDEISVIGDGFLYVGGP